MEVLVSSDAPLASSLGSLSVMCRKISQVVIQHYRETQ